MAGQLAVSAVGAVTAIGLDAPQFCAAFRAGISGIRRIAFQPPPEALLPAAPIPGRRILRPSEHAWLLNLASRAIHETLDRTDLRPETIVLLLSLPEPFRGHPAFFQNDPQEFVAVIESRLGIRFAAGSRILVDGHAAPLRALSGADALIGSGVLACLVCGVDSLLNSTDLEALLESGRLYAENQPQGIIPGEAAACVLLARADAARSSLAMIAGWGEATEQKSIMGDDYSTGEGLSLAIARAVAAAGVAEPQIAFRVSDMNGERYHAWESFMAATRFYRTHRDRFPFHLPATSVGDVGAAAGVLTLVVAAMSIARGYAPGEIACCETSSTEGWRAAAIMRPIPGAPIPPFRSRFRDT